MKERLLLFKTSVEKKADIEKASQDVLRLKKTATDDLAKLEKDLAGIRENLKQLPEAEPSEKSLPELQKELIDIKAEGLKIIGDIDKELEGAKGDIETLKDNLKLLDPESNFEVQKADLLAIVVKLDERIEVARKDEVSLRQSVGAVLEALRQIDEAKMKRAAAEKDIASTNREISEWAILRRRFQMTALLP